MELIKRKLQNWGYSEIITLDNGEDAFKYLIQNKNPALVIMDWMMPGKNGNEIFQELPEDQSKIYFKILLTAKNTTEDMHFGISCGADQYLTKPIDFSELKEAVEAGSKKLS